ncbi:NPCBM/NEW2 domain-containing protein [Paenibacillus sp. MWE-103]|uniref:NPCBM/NEW2 domain-containing protein n=1 Tax=Paenibacillus artemisiicola TaxID=1172618 RepID=A0ABS3WBW9_9BACL|nr:NPCBM/NEW2 domain-containing protein [Paenibacillus artemisiicola]MBO7745782.1 NPCBM/NEW2 domain-containing protein [Paenibacillus artemisiicola]
MKDKVKGLAAGLLIGTLITGSAAYAAGSSTKIEVAFQSVKYMFDGVQKTAPDNAIVYKGQMYAPVKFIAESAGKGFSYDSKNHTAWIGKKEGAFKYLTDISYARVNAKYESLIDFNQNYQRQKITIADNTYQKGINFAYYSYDTLGKQPSIEYNLNGKYNKLTGFVGIDDYTKNSNGSVTYRFIGDDNELLTVENVRGGDNPKQVTVDVTGVLKLKIEVEFVSEDYQDIFAAFAEPKLFQ